MTRRLLIGGGSGIGEDFLEHRQDDQEEWERPPRDVLDIGATGDFARWLDLGAAPVDELVVTAGENYLMRLGDMNPERLAQIYRSNVLGQIEMLDELVSFQASYPVSIVFVGSDAAIRPMRTSIAYCSSKAALHMAVRVAAREMAEDGWRVNAVAPGMTEGTEMTKYVDKTVQAVRGWSEEFMLDYERQQEVTPGRVSRCEVSAAILWMLRGPAHVNGEILFVNGGR